MLSIFICEDNQSHKDQIQKCIADCIMIHNLDMKIVLSTNDPEAIIRHLKEEPAAGLYFLDVDLKHEINGLTLAKTIREYDPRGFIVFITTHEEALPLTFHFKLEAMDFILKDEFYDLKNKIYDCILNAQSKYSAKATELQKTFTIDTSDKKITVEYSKILYFETSTDFAHKVKLHTTYGIFEFYETLNQLENSLGESFYRCHHSYIINLKQHLRLEIKEKNIYFSQGSSCPVASRRLKQLIKLLNN